MKAKRSGLISYRCAASKRRPLLFAVRLAALFSFINFQYVLPLAFVIAAVPHARAANIELPLAIAVNGPVTFLSSATFNNAALFMGSVTLSGITAPPVAPAGKANLYYNATSDHIKLSENGGDYFDLRSWTVSGSNLYNTGRPQNVLVNTVTALSSFTVTGGVSVSTSATANVLFFVSASSGTVGIATVNPSERLEVNGNLKATMFLGDGKLLENLPPMPLGGIFLFEGACPSGWAELTTAQGRFLTGAPSGGTISGTLGTAITNLADASYTPVGSVAAPTFTGNAGTTAAEAAHTHGMQTHTHTTDIAAFTSGAEAAHTHAYTTGGPSAGVTYYWNFSGYIPDTGHTHSGTTAAGSSHSHSVNPPATASGGPSAANTAASSHSHSFTPDGSIAAPAFTGTANTTMRSVIAPYMQLRLCQNITGAGTDGYGWDDTGDDIVLVNNNALVGVGTLSPQAKLNIAGGALQMNATASPGVSTAGTGRIYFDSTDNRFKLSANGGAYKYLLEGTVGYIPKYDTAVSVVNSVMQETASGIGIGRAPGTVGAAKLELYGTSANIAGPHLQAVTSADNYPVFQQLNWTHDNIQLLFDAYYDGAQRSSDAGSNYRLLKNADTLTLNYGSGYAAGSVITWNVGLRLDSSGRLGIGLTPDTTVKLHVDGKLRIDESTVSVSGTDMYLVPSGSIGFFDGSVCPTGWTEVVSARVRAARGWDGATAAGDSNVGGADTHSHTTDIALFTTGAEAAHTHAYTTGGPSAGIAYYSSSSDPAAPSNAHTHTGTTGAGASHAHSANPPSTTSDSPSNVPAYRAFLTCKKN